MPTITTSSSSHFKPGDRIRFADLRPWWLKLWHWIRRHKPQRDFIITEVTDSTTATLKPPFD
jgi:hypothetical protein